MVVVVVVGPRVLISLSTSLCHTIHFSFFSDQPVPAGSRRSELEGIGFRLADKPLLPRLLMERCGEICAHLYFRHLVDDLISAASLGVLLHRV